MKEERQSMKFGEVVRLNDGIMVVLTLLALNE